MRVWEVEPPEGSTPLEWVLYCDDAVTNLADAVAVVEDYRRRVLIEEFHKGLKTGLGAERLQLETAPRLFAAIALMSVVALRLLDLRELGRRCGAAPATTSGLDGLELALLGQETGRPLGTVADVLLAVGRLGGHMNRAADGLPGWLTLWRGMSKLRLLVRGAKLAQTIGDANPHGGPT